jgi:ABC-type maltose transport system permease subunit
MLLICVMVSGATKVIPLYLVLLRFGQLNTHFGLILTYSAELIPISVWLMKSYLDAIPRELDEAGLTDGAGRIRVFLELVLPVSLPGLMAVILFVFVKASQEFIYASTFISEPSLKTAPAGLYLFLTEIGVQWSNLAAAGLLVVLPVVLIFLLLQRWFIGGLTAGAVK